MSTCTLQVGDEVEWTSGAQGYSKTKRGIVAEVVPPKEYPSREKFERLYRHAGVGLYRDETSYVVMVGNKPYWPRVRHLRRVNQ